VNVSVALELSRGFAHFVNPDPSIDNFPQEAALTGVSGIQFIPRIEGF
jgi:hypothetical protein